MIIDKHINSDNINQYPWDKVTELLGYLDLRGGRSDFNAPLLKKLGGITLEGSMRKFNAPLLHTMESGLNLGRYQHDFNAPSLKYIKGDICLKHFPHHFNVPLLETSGALNLYCFGQDFNAPLLKTIYTYGNNGIYATNYKHKMALDSLETIGGRLILDSYGQDLYLPSLNTVGGIKLVGYDYQLNAPILQNSGLIFGEQYSDKRITRINDMPYIVKGKIEKDDLILYRARPAKMVNGTFGGDPTFIANYKDIYVRDMGIDIFLSNSAGKINETW